VRSAPCTRRRGVRVSWLSIKTKVKGLLVVWPQNHWVGFPSLGLKIGSYGLVIYTSKLLRWFLGLGLKTKQAIVCRLRHKTNERMKTALGTRRDLVVWFTWKQVGLGFPSLVSRLLQARRRWCTWHHHRGHTRIKSKMDESMRWAALDPTTLTLSFLLYYVLGVF
jgi:hypothetical protein